MMRVGFNYGTPKRPRFYTYNHVKYDNEGWADPKEYLPYDYDIVELKRDNYKPIIPGWISGNRWDGRKFKSQDKVIGWRRPEPVRCQ